MKTRTASDSKTINSYIVRPAHSNGYGRLFGGILMQWIDEMSVMVAQRHCHKNVTTAAVDQLLFQAPAHVGDMVVLVGQITYVGHSSMEVQVHTYVEDRHDGERRLINRAFVVMVAIDENGKAVSVPALELLSEEEKNAWIDGEKRCQLRRRRRNEGF